MMMVMMIMAAAAGVVVPVDMIVAMVVGQRGRHMSVVMRLVVGTVLIRHPSVLDCAVADAWRRHLSAACYHARLRPSKPVPLPRGRDGG